MFGWTGRGVAAALGVCVQMRCVLPALGVDLGPKYHLTDGRTMLSDPSGPVWLNGHWALFPDGARAQNGTVPAFFWSRDLVHWERRLTDMQFGETGGVTVLPGGRAVTFGSGGRWSATRGVAQPFAHWTALPKGGVDPHTAGRAGEPPGPPDQRDSGLFRVGDPSAPFEYNGRWYLVLGGGRNSSGPPYTRGEARLVRATNESLASWEFVSVMFASNSTAGHWAAPVSNMFECPDFFRLGGRWMLLASQIFQAPRWPTGANHHWDQYRIGSFDGQTFLPTDRGVLDYGYVAAGKTGGGPGGRRVFFGWNMPWSRQRASQLRYPVEEPFSTQVLPRDLSLAKDGTLRMAPVPELAALRSPDGQFHAEAVTESRGCVARGRQIELNVTVSVGTGPEMPGLAILSSGDGQERTWVGCNQSHLIVNQLNSSLAPDQSGQGAWWYSAWVNNHTVLAAPLPIQAQHVIRVFVDGSNLEVFADERVAISTNVFPTLQSADCVDLEPATGSLASVSIYHLVAAPVSGIPP